MHACIRSPNRQPSPIAVPSGSEAEFYVKAHLGSAQPHVNLVLFPRIARLHCSRQYRIHHTVLAINDDTRGIELIPRQTLAQCHGAVVDLS